MEAPRAIKIPSPEFGSAPRPNELTPIKFCETTLPAVSSPVISTPLPSLLEMTLVWLSSVFPPKAPPIWLSDAPPPIQMPSPPLPKPSPSI
jgi:hypothetical protein